MGEPDLHEHRIIDVLTPQLKKVLTNHYILEAYAGSGCTRADGFAGMALTPVCKMERRRAVQASPETGLYNHCPQLAKWRNRYWLGWLNCKVSEGYPGQSVLVSSSTDLRIWSDPTVLAKGNERTGFVQRFGGLFAFDERLYAFCEERLAERWDLAEAADPALREHDGTRVSRGYDLYETSDGERWTRHGMGIDVEWMLQKARRTKEGRLMGPATIPRQGPRRCRPAVLLWPSDDPRETPEIIDIPGAEKGFPYAEGDWCYDNEGRIWNWLLDVRFTGYLAVTLSEDDRRTWTAPFSTNFPDAASRTASGRL